MVLQTFPGGIHSGSDWYMNDAGIVIGETTVGQTPFAPEGTPQSNRARKAAQYGTSIDEVARILREKNNGLYTNDWTIADAKTDEGADLLLGTSAWKLWRTGSPGHPADTPGGLRDFVWANNNTRDPAVRREYARSPGRGPGRHGLQRLEPGHRLLEVLRAVRQGEDRPRGRGAPLRLVAGEPAARLRRQAHHRRDGRPAGLHRPLRARPRCARSGWGAASSPTCPNAVPHFTLGYTTFSPIVVADGLKAARARAGKPAPAAGRAEARRGGPQGRLPLREEAPLGGDALPGRATPTTGSPAARRPTGPS